MKILTLNTWGGRAGGKGVLDFLKRESETVDIFCLQEIWSAPYEHLEGVNAGGVAMKHEDIMVYGVQEITSLLTDYEYFFHPHFMEHYGLLMLVKQGIDVVGSGDVFVYRDQGYIPDGDIGHHARNVQYVHVKSNGKKITICNFHGLWNGKGKDDCPERIEQSKNIIKFLETCGGEIVLAGDFNLNPDTESVKIFEDFGLRNLIREYKVTSTRTSFYAKPLKFADYIFVSKGLQAQNFKVLPDEVSDHAPLCIEVY